MKQQRGPLQERRQKKQAWKIRYWCSAVGSSGEIRMVTIPARDVDTEDPMDALGNEE